MPNTVMGTVYIYTTPEVLDFQDRLSHIP